MPDDRIGDPVGDWASRPRDWPEGKSVWPRGYDDECSGEAVFATIAGLPGLVEAAVPCLLVRTVRRHWLRSRRYAVSTTKRRPCA